MKTKDNNYLFGCGGHAKVIWDATQVKGRTIKGCFSDGNNNTFHKTLPHLGKLTKKFNTKNCYLHIAIGNNATRKQKAELYNCTYFNVVHPKSYVSKNITLGEGTAILAHTTISPFAQIGSHCIINTASVIEHDCSISDYVHIAPNATLCGNVSVGEGTLIGAGAVIIPEINIGKWATIGAGTVIIENIPNFAVVVGNPGKIIKYNQ